MSKQRVIQALMRGHVEVFEVFEVITNTDLTEGHGHERVLAVCEAEGTALRLGRGKYVQGHDCPIRRGVAVRIGGRGVTLVAGHVEAMTEDDRRAEKALAESRERTKRVNELIERMRSMGVSEEEVDLIIQALRGDRNVEH